MLFLYIKDIGLVSSINAYAQFHLANFINKIKIYKILRLKFLKKNYLNFDKNIQKKIGMKDEIKKI